MTSRPWRCRVHPSEPRDEHRPWRRTAMRGRGQFLVTFFEPFRFRSRTHSSESSTREGRRVSSENFVDSIGGVLDRSSVSPSGGRDTAEFRRRSLVLEPDACTGRSFEGGSCCSGTEVVESEVGSDGLAGEARGGAGRTRQKETRTEEETPTHQSISWSYSRL